MAGRCIAFFAGSRYFFSYFKFLDELKFALPNTFWLTQRNITLRHRRSLETSLREPTFGNPHPANAGLEGCKQPGLHGGVGFICYFMEISWQKKSPDKLSLTGLIFKANC